jgi:hypothetical protein
MPSDFQNITAPSAADLCRRDRQLGGYEGWFLS